MFQVENLPANQFVESRLVFPKNYILAIISSDKTLQNILDEEESYLNSNKRREFLKDSFLYLYLIVLVLWTIYWIITWLKYGKEYKHNIPQYFHNPPSKLQPALVELLLNQNNSISSKSFMATLLDLAQKKHLTIISRRYLKHFLFATTSKYEYSITFKSKDDSKLAKFEKDFLNEIQNISSFLI